MLAQNENNAFQGKWYLEKVTLKNRASNNWAWCFFIRTLSFCFGWGGTRECTERVGDMQFINFYILSPLIRGNLESPIVIGLRASVSYLKAEKAAL